MRTFFPLNQILEVVGFSKSTYMYWQKRFDRENKDLNIEIKIKNIRKDNPNYGYRRIHAVLRRLGLLINKKKVQRIIQKLSLQVRSFTRKSRKYYSYKGQVGKVAKNNKLLRNEIAYTGGNIRTFRSCYKNNKGL